MPSDWTRRLFYGLASALHLKRDETRNLVILALLFFMSNLGICLGRAARDAVFLAKAGASGLPWMYITSAFMVVGGAILYGAMLRSLHPRRLHAFTLFGLGFLLAAAFLMARTEMPASAVALYLACQVAWSISMIQFWNLATEIFDPQLGKRLFPMLGNVGLLAMMAAGIFSAALVRIIGATGLVLVWAALVFASMPLARRIVESNRLGRKVAEKGTKDRGAWTELRNSRYFRLFCAATAIMWAASYLIDYIFCSSVRERYSDPAMLAGFLGFFQYGMVGLAALAANLLITTAAIRGMGVAACAMVYPSLILASLALYAVFGGFHAAAALKFADSLLFYTLHSAVYQLLFSPIAQQLRGVLRSFLDGVLKPLFIALAGAAILLAQRFGAQDVIGWLALALAGLWTLASLSQRKSYGVTLMEMLRSGGRILKAEAMDALRMAKDSRIFARLLMEASSPDPRRSGAALDSYAALGGQMRLQTLAPLLLHPSEEIRARVVKASAPELNEKKQLVSFLSDSSGLVVAEAAAQAGRLGALSAARLEELARDERPLVRTEASLQSACLDGSAEGRPKISAMLEQASPALRGYVLSRLGELGKEDFGTELKSSLDSPDQEEFAGAVKLALHPRYAASVDLALELLKNPNKARGAETVLLAHPPLAFARLDRPASPDWPEHMLRRWPLLLIRSGGAAGRGRVIRSMEEGCPRIRRYCAEALVFSEADSPLSGADLEAVSFLLPRCVRETRRLAEEHSLLERSLGRSRGWELLAEALDDRRRDLRTTCLFLTGLGRRKGRDCALIEHRLERSSLAAGHALEMLESLMGRDPGLQNLIGLYGRQAALAREGDLPPRPEDRVLGDMLENGLPWERWAVMMATGDRLAPRNSPPMINLEHFFFMQSVPIFTDLRKEDLFSLSELSREAVYGRSEEVFHEGDDGNCLFIIMKGGVEVIVSGESGPRVVASLGEKQCFGEMALLDDETRSATVRASSPLSCLILEKEDFQHLLAERAGLSRQIIKTLVRRIREANKERV